MNFLLENLLILKFIFTLQDDDDIDEDDDQPSTKRQKVEDESND